MRITRKIPAFTLSELLVVLIISIIIIGLAFSTLNIINKNFNHYRNWYLSSTQKSNLEVKLSVDFHRSQHAFFKESENLLVFQRFNKSLESVEYKFLKNRIIIKSDTLEIPYKYYRFFFNGKRVEDGPIDGLKIIFSNPKNDFLFTSKFNSSQNFMKDEI